MTRGELLRRIQALPEDQQEEAWSLAVDMYGSDISGGADVHREAAKRAAYAGRPGDYLRDILKVKWLTPQQEEWLRQLDQHDRILVAAATNVGKTFVLGGYGLYRFDAVAAVTGPDGTEQGARVLLVGPVAESVKNTLYDAIRKHAMRAAAAGNLMPGVPTKHGWWAGPEWAIEIFAPARRVGQPIAESVQGRHHVNQVALIEEASAVEEATWAGAESSCSGAGNKVIAIFNPHVDRGAAHERRSRYKLIHASAFDHPNIRDRRTRVPGAVSHSGENGVDERVRNECRDLGPYPATPLDRRHNDFAYALPAKDAKGDGVGRPRKDGVVGHPQGQARAYRPGPLFEAQVLGRWPTSSGGGLFDLITWDEGVARWKAGEDPEEPPDRVGVDPAREGENESIAAPAWGESAETLLLAHAEARRSGPEAIARLHARRIRVGEMVVLPPGKGHEVADALMARFPGCPYLVDEGGPGASVLDACIVAGAQVQGVSYGSSPPEPTPGEPWSENLRTAMYIRAALLVAYGLVDPPPDALLRQEVLAYTLKHRFRTVVVTAEHGATTKERKPSVLLVEKDEIKRRIGRSPDRADAFVTSLSEYIDQGEVGAPVFSFPSAQSRQW